MNGEPSPDAVSGAEPGTEGRKDAPSPRFRGWRRNVLLALGGVLAILAAATGWVVLDPGVLRSAVEHLASGATGRPVSIGALDLQWVEGRAVVEAREVRVGKTTTERVSFSLAGLRSHANGDGVRFPNGSSIGHFRASLDLSLTGLPRISTVDASGAVLVAVRRGPSDATGPPPLGRLLVVPRILLRLGLERLVLHSGTLEYRGRSSTHSAGLTAVIDATGQGIAFGGELLVGPGIPLLPFDGTVRDPMGDDWQIDVRLTGEDVPMEGIRFLAGVLEPGPIVRTALGRLSSRARFALLVRLAGAHIESADLDFTFGAPEGADESRISPEGVRFLATTVPDPGGWTVTGEVDWSRLTEERNPERSPFTVRWSTGVPGSLRWSARRGPVSLLARIAHDALPPGDSLRSALERLQLAGTIEELAAFGNPGASDEPSFWLSAVVSGFEATAGDWRISEAGARVEFAEGRWRARFAGDRFNAGVPSFRSVPYELTLEGEVEVTDGETGWTARTGDLRFATAGLAGRIDGSLAIPRPDGEAAPSLDAEIRLDDVALTDIGDLLPDRRAVGFTRWYRRAMRSGRLTGSTVRIRGDPRGIPFRDGEGSFHAQGTVHDVDFAYAEGWPAVRIEGAGMRADGAALEFSEIRGSIFDTLVEDGFARLPDTTNPAGRVRASLAGSGPARDLLAFVRASPLRTQDGGPAPELHADGPTSTTAKLDIPYGRGARGRRIDVSGTIALDGAALRLAGRRAVLEEVRGELAFDAESLTGGPLHGRFRGSAIETHVEFNRDDGLVLRFSGEGDGDWFAGALDDLVDLGREETDPWLEPVTGRAAWDAEYRSQAGIAFRSDLRTASVDFPPPFGKPTGTPRHLEVVLTPGETEWVIDASYGADTRGTFEIAETEGEWGVARGAVTVDGARPALPSKSHVEVSGALAELDLDPWLALGAAGAPEPTGWLSRIGRVSLDMAGARVLDRRIDLSRLDLAPARDGSGFRVRLEGKGVAGDVSFPSDPTAGRAHVRLDRLHFTEPLVPGEDDDAEPAGESSGNDAGPKRWPSFDVRIGSLRFDRLDLGVVEVIGDRTGNGLEIDKIAFDSPDLRISGRGSWLTGEGGAPASRFEATMNTDDLSRLLNAAGLDEEAAAGGTVEVRLDLAWPGSPLEPSLPALEGRIEMDAENGHLPRVRVGPLGRLFALMSLDALPRVLALDLSHVVGKGFAYDRITARTNIEDGKARIQEFTIVGPSAQIEVSGSLDLASRRYDEEISVIPRLTRSGALLPAWTAAWPLLVANFVLEKAAGDEIILDRLFRLRYRLQGPLDDPEIERIRTSRNTGQEK